MDGKLKLPKGVTKLPTGVEIHGAKIRIRFTFRGERCRELIEAPLTKASIMYAENKLKSIKVEIAENRFDYAAHFPNSPNAGKFTGCGVIDVNRTVEQGVTRWLEVQEAKQAKSTFQNYKYKANHVTAKWGKARIADLSRSHIELFQSELLKKGLSPKTVNDVFTIIRGVWSYAHDDGVIKSNPCDKVSNVERHDDDDFADPFTRDELERIAKLDTRRQEDVNMIMFACWCGLSVSELIALAWEDIDTVKWTVRVQRARVNTEYKVPKEKVRVRDVELVGDAIHWLKRQMQHTYMSEPTELLVRQRDNVSVKTQSVRLVFNNGASEGPWHARSLNRWFTSHLRRAKVRHRGPNQCRHTFASQCITNYVPLEWVARQLGHSDTTMIKKHYGRWIPKDAPSMAGMVTQMLSGSMMGQGGLQNSDIGPGLAQDPAERGSSPAK